MRHLAARHSSTACRKRTNELSHRPTVRDANHRDQVMTSGITVRDSAAVCVPRRGSCCPTTTKGVFVFRSRRISSTHTDSLRADSRAASSARAGDINHSSRRGEPVSLQTCDDPGTATGTPGIASALAAAQVS
jgi:hypothetical protein